MLFQFLTYLHPTHYFQLFRKDGTSIYPLVTVLPAEILAQLSKDDEYVSNDAKNYDLSWQAIKKGYIGAVPTYTDFEKLPIKDEYRFIKKNFHPVWTLYVLLVRLFSLKNPIRELNGFWSQRKVKRQSLEKEPIAYPDYSTFTSTLIAQRPLVSIVIPTLNRYNYLKDILKDFELQTYKHFEIIVVDQSQPYQADFYEQFQLVIRPVHQKEPALWLARNTAVEVSKGEIIMLSEDDVRIEKDWIENHLKCLDFFNAEISAGVFFPENSSIPQDRSYFSVASQFATGNAALYKKVFKKIGLFDRQFERQRMGDGEFGLRAYLHGIKSVSTPYASCIDVKAGTGGLRQMGSWDAFRPKKWFSPRPIPSVLYLFRRYFGKKRTYLSLLKTVPPSIIPYRFKKNKKMMLLGIFISVFLLPLIVIQVLISWRMASKKIKQGTLIRELK
ncbi:MAG: glycosyltransferase family 2 protein [Flavobacteriaceae bacterium]|nr:glycosyltransferase family 2 protein [Flavobacteriaceae bacterium]